MTDTTNTTRTIALLATDGVEQIELTEPKAALEDAGMTVHLIAPDPEFDGFDHLDRADTFTADHTVADADPDAYDALLLPGGVANPDALRQDEDAVAFVRAFFAADKTVAAICHAPWMLIEANQVNDRHLTSFPSLRTDLENAGAHWIDEEVVIDRNGPGALITSRSPADLEVFNRTILDELGDGS